MLEDKMFINEVNSSLLKYFESLNKKEVARIIKQSTWTSEVIDYLNWNGGTQVFALCYNMEIEDFIKFQPMVEIYQNELLEAAQLFDVNSYDEQLSQIYIRPIRRTYLNWSDLPNGVNKQLVLSNLKEIKEILTMVATGKKDINEVQNSYNEIYKLLQNWLKILRLDNPNKYDDLWMWWGYFKKTGLTSYQSRREYIINLYADLETFLSESTDKSVGFEYIPTGWERVDRTIYEMTNRLFDAINEEQFQSIGMLGREAIITVAQQVFEKDVHKSLDGVDVSETDSKRMLEAFLSHELAGSSNERTRKFAKSAVDMANHLTHDRTATRRDAEMCLISVTAMASLIKTIYTNIR